MNNSQDNQSGISNIKKKLSLKVKVHDGQGHSLSDITGSKDSVDSLSKDPFQPNIIDSKIGTQPTILPNKKSSGKFLEPNEVIRTPGKILNPSPDRQDASKNIWFNQPYAYQNDFLNMKRYREEGIFPNFSPNLSAGSLKPNLPNNFSPSLPAYFMFNNIQNNFSTMTPTPTQMKNMFPREHFDYSQLGIAGMDYYKDENNSLPHQMPVNSANNLPNLDQPQTPMTGNKMNTHPGFYNWVMQGSPLINKAKSPHVPKKSKYKNEMDD